MVLDLHKQVCAMGKKKDAISEGNEYLLGKIQSDVVVAYKQGKYFIF